MLKRNSISLATPQLPHLQEEAHVGALPDQLTGCAGTEDGVAFAAVAEELHQVLGEKCPVGLGQHDQLARRLLQPPARRVAVALLGLDDPSGAPSSRPRSAVPVLRVVVDDQDLVDIARVEEARR